MYHGGIPSPPISYFDLGPLRVHFYALCILVGIAIAVALTNSRLKRRGVESGSVLDVAIWTVPIGLVGGRFYHVFTHPNDYFAKGDQLWHIFAIWEGGLAIFGSILFGTLGAYIGCRLHNVSFSTFADALIPGLLLAQAFGRFGNYFNQELYGNPTTLPWGLQISPASPAYPAGVPAYTLFQPLFLYEMIWNILGAILIILLGRRFTFRRGQQVGLYFLWYGSARAVLEHMRLDPTEYLLAGLKINEVVAILAAIMGLVIFVVATRRNRPQEEPSAVVVEGAEDANGAVGESVAAKSSVDDDAGVSDDEGVSAATGDDGVSAPSP